MPKPYDDKYEHDHKYEYDHVYNAPPAGGGRVRACVFWMASVFFHKIIRKNF